MAANHSIRVQPTRHRRCAGETESERASYHNESYPHHLDRIHLSSIAHPTTIFNRKLPQTCLYLDPVRERSRTLAQPTPLSPDWQRLSTFRRSREPCARIAALTSASPRCVTARRAWSEDPRHPSAHQVASDAACSGGDFVGKRGSGIRFPSRRKPAPVTAREAAPPHQMVSGDVPSSTPPTAGPRATPTMKLNW